MSPEYVRPYVKAQKNDDRDAEGIAEAASRPTMRFVELKTQEQLDIQTLHRQVPPGGRAHEPDQPTAGDPAGAGTIFPAGRRKLELGIDAMLAAEDTTLSPRCSNWWANCVPNGTNLIPGRGTERRVCRTGSQ
jgi:hypothetical protein